MYEAMEPHPRSVKPQNSREDDLKQQTVRQATQHASARTAAHCREQRPQTGYHAQGAITRTPHLPTGRQDTPPNLTLESGVPRLPRADTDNAGKVTDKNFAIPDLARMGSI